jgi:hypothetical protein
MSEVTAASLIARYASHTLTCMYNATKARSMREGNGYGGRDWMLREACTCGLRALLAANSVSERLLGEASDNHRLEN